MRTFLCEQPCERRRHAIGVLPGGAVAAALVDGLVDAASRRDEGGGIPIDIGFRAVCADGLARTVTPLASMSLRMARMLGMAPASPSDETIQRC